LYYVCASIHQQQLKGKNYNELEAVHQVFLMAGSRKSVRCPDGHYQLLNIENGESLTDKMKISMINLERVVEEIDDFRQMNDLQKWCLFFCRGHMFNHEGIQLLMKEERFRKAERIMRDVNQDEMLKDAAFQRMKDELDHFTRLSNARKEGRTEGIEIAEARHQKENEQRIIQMIQDGLDEVQIMKYCSCTKEEIIEYQKKL
jgi:predicted transposase/invertase (TIGR01784 family)